MRLYSAISLSIILGAILHRKFAVSLNQTKTAGELADETLTIISENAPSVFTDDVILVLSPGNYASLTNASVTSHVSSSTPLQDDILTKAMIQPYLTSHPKTSIVVYNVSKFSKNASLDIATAFNIKMVLNHARRVKIALVFNYNLMISDNRTCFATFLDNVSNFIKSCSKYRAGIALIASHCKTSGNVQRQQTIRRIGRVLQDMKKNASTNRICLIDALLTRDMDGLFSHIGYFYKLDFESLGSSTTIDILYNIKYISKSTSDFVFSLTPGAKSLLHPLTQKVHLRIMTSYNNLASEIQTHYDKLNSTSIASTIGKLILEYRSLTTLISNLEKNQIRKNFTEFSIKTLTNQMKVKIGADVIKSIRVDTSLLDFLDSFALKSTVTGFTDWLRSFSKSSDAVFARIINLGNVLNNQMESALNDASKEMMSAYRSKLSQWSYSVADEQIWHDIHRDYERLRDVKIFIPAALTFNEFVNLILSIIQKLAIRNNELTFSNHVAVPSKEDFNLYSVQGRPLSFNVYAWISPLEKLVTFLSIEQNLLEDRFRKRKQEKSLEELRVSMQERCDRAIQEITANFSARCERCV